MATIGKDKNGCKRVLFYDSNGKRKTVRLGKVSNRIAQTAKFHIEGLLSATIAGHSPELETGKWLAGIDDLIYKRLVNVGLALPRHTSDKVTIKSFLEGYLASRTDIAVQTRKNMRVSINRLRLFFGDNRVLASIIEGDADDYRQWLVNEKYAPATISKEIIFARQIFKSAARKQLIQNNPFTDVKAGKQTNTDRIHFIDQETIRAVLDACPKTQWQLVFAFARYGGVRIPSEIKFLRWSDVNWARNRITITVPKKAHIDGHQTRVIPLFPELRPFLDKAFEEAAEGEEYVVPLARQTGNLRTHALRIIEKAGVKVWPKPFQNLRASRENELMQQHPAHLVLAWIGHTAAVARDHYLKVTDADYDRASGKAARNPAPSASVSSGQGPSEEMKSKENPANAGNRKNSVPPAGVVW
jgi:integrase